MPSLVATTSTPAWKPFVRTHYIRTNYFSFALGFNRLSENCIADARSRKMKNSYGLISAIGTICDLGIVIIYLDKYL